MENRSRLELMQEVILLRKKIYDDEQLLNDCLSCLQEAENYVHSQTSCASEIYLIQERIKASLSLIKENL